MLAGRKAGFYVGNVLEESYFGIYSCGKCQKCLKKWGILLESSSCQGAKFKHFIDEMSARDLKFIWRKQVKRLILLYLAD